MSSIKDALLGAAADCSDYRTVSKDTAIVTVEPPAYKAAGRDHHAYTIDEEGVGTGCVSFHDVSYEVSSCFGRRRKVILSRVSGLLPQGLNAIMGPTGSGKTSLLDILAGRKDRSGLVGQVMINGEHQPRNFKCISGYVVQDDIIMDTLTVRENFHFSASLRLPSHMTRQQRKERVEKVIDELGLTKCANTRIGNEFLRGVSGGERKRTSIGMELIIEPQVLFLDEPTTGLDANTAISVVQQLKQLSEKGNHIVIMSIHQPRYSIFKLFDTLTLLSAGNVVYHGQANNALEYFHGAGFHCEEHDNPADFFLDVVTSCEKAGGSSGFQDGKTESTAKVDLAEYYQNSEQFRSVQEELKPIADSAVVGSRRKGKTPSYATGFFWQMLIVGNRSLTNIVRNPMMSIIQWVILVFFSLLIGTIFYRLDSKEYNPQTVISDRLGAMFFMIMNLVLINLPAVDLFIRDKALFIHENVSGYYRATVFFLAKVLIDLASMRIIPLCIYCCIVYFMVGFTVDVSNFFIFLLTLMLTAITATSQAYAVSSRLSTVAVANLLLALLFILFLLFAGFLIALSSLPEWISWIKYLSLFKYSLEALSINDLNGRYFCPNGTFTETPADFEDCTSGTLALDNLGYSTEQNWLWYDQVGLVGLSLIFLAITYLNLLTIKKLK